MSSQPTASQKIWDAPVRLTHWALVVLVCFSWWTAESGRLDWHRYSGYAVLALLLFRIYWGLLGSTTARFSHFVRGPRQVMAYLRAFRQPVAFAGHNPLGALSVIALLAALLTQVLSGLFAVDTDGLESGPLAVWVSFRTGRQMSDLHELSFNVLLGLIVLHVLAIAIYRIFKRQDLLTPMISGKAQLPPGAAQGLRFQGVVRAMVGLLLALLVAYAVSRGLRL